MTKLLLSTAAIVMLAAPAAQAQGLTAEQKTEIESLVRDYIIAHPQVLIESLEKHRDESQRQAEAEATEAAKLLVSELKNGNGPSVGPDDADVIVVEFMDYNCGYCKKAYEEVQAVLDTDKKVKFYFIEMPILGPTSLEASKWALAAHDQGKYFDYHRALMKHQGQKSESVLESKAKEVGLDIDKAKTFKESEAVQKALSDNIDSADKLGISGTPGFIVGEEVVRGYITLDQMKELIGDARS